MTPEQRHRTRYASFIVNFEQIPHRFLLTY